MVLFIEKKEAQLIKLTVTYMRAMMTPELKQLADKVVTRIETCEQMQNR